MRSSRASELGKKRFLDSYMKVGIAVPTYNEKANLQTLIDRLLKVFENNELSGHLVIVDNNSTDGTGQLANHLAEKHENISVIHRPGKLGLGSAYKEAFELLLKDPEVTVVMEMYADLSHEREYIPSLLGKIDEGYDVVVGSRYVADGGIDHDWAPIRRFISKSANFLTKLLVGLNVKDDTSGFRAYDSVALKSIDLSKVRTNGYAFQIDMSFHCTNLGCEIAEVPIIFKERKHGASKLGSFAIMEFVKILENSFAGRIRTFLNALQSTSVFIGNSLWIGIKPLRAAIREANSHTISNRSFTEQNLGFGKNDGALQR
jgi:dolichol-phosphate mannosyltransferase